MSESLVVDVGEGTVSARLYAADTAWAWCLFAHGAGAPQTSSFMVTAARLFAAHGVTTLTFNFPYMEAKRRIPDRAPVLEACLAVVLAAGRSRLGADLPVFLAGKSMGGRMATHIAAQSRTPDGGRIHGVICLGYPLHPPGRPTHLRNQHLPKIRVPLLFIQGTRDSFGGPDELRSAFPAMPPGSRIREVDGGDHSFKVPSQARATEDQRLAPLIADAAAWMREVLARNPVDDAPDH